MQKAQKRNAAREEKFWFRKDITTHISPPEANECCRKGTMNCDPKDCDMFGLMTINEVINGKVNSLITTTTTLIKISYAIIKHFAVLNTAFFFFSGR